MTVTQSYPSIASIPITEPEVLYPSRNFDTQPQINFQQQQQQEQEHQPQHSYLDPALAQHDLRVFTQGLAHNPSYGIPIAPYPASDSSEGSIGRWGGIPNWIDGKNACEFLFFPSLSIGGRASLLKDMGIMTSCSKRGVRIR